MTSFAVLICRWGEGKEDRKPLLVVEKQTEAKETMKKGTIS